MEIATSEDIKIGPVIIDLENGDSVTITRNISGYDVKVTKASMYFWNPSRVYPIEEIGKPYEITLTCNGGTKVIEK